MLSSIKTYIKSAIYDPVSKLMASITSSGNLKTSIEELATGISSNTNAQLNTTQFDSTGNEVGMVTNTDDDTNIDGEIGIVTAAGLYARTSSTIFKPLRMDASTHSIQIIDYAHHEIHSGSTFCVHLADNAVAKDTEMGCIFTTPSGDKWFHCVYSVDMGAKSTFDILEAPTVDVVPDLTNFYVPRNRNRNSDTVSTALSVRATPVANQVTLILDGDASPISADGTVLHTEIIGGAKKGKTASDGHTHDDEYILKADTTYYFRVTGDNTGDANLQMSMEIIWYEHSNKN